MMIPIAFDVSMEDPPPIATIASALNSFAAFTPAKTFSTGGLATLASFSTFKYSLC